MVQCALCKSVADAIEKKVTKWPGEHVWKYSDVQQNAECVTCQKVVRMLKIHEPPAGVEDCGGFVGYSPYNKSWHLQLRRKRINGKKGSSLLMRMEIQVIPNAAEFSLFGQEIEIQGIKRWVNKCDKDHAGICHTMTNTKAKMPDTTDLRFIDVENLCLAKQSVRDRCTRYAALSYVWGTTVDPFQTMKANVEALSQEYAFDLPCNRTRLPNTIADSISFTRALGLRYLWVDRFSIVQDDEITKPHQLASMASIYSNAYITIAATEGGDSHYGIPGVNEERPRKPPSEILEFSPSCRLQALVRISGSPRTTYHTRGWTFQEWTFSRRTIVFHDQTVSWLCERSQQQENLQYPYMAPTKLRQDQFNTYPNISGYCNAVEIYSIRQLTHPEDILAAFNAFMTVQGRAMKSSFLFGIPELFLSNMLCWHHGQGPFSNDGRRFQQRRTDRQGNILKTFPSWSWVGWLGRINMHPAADESSRLAKRRVECSILDYPHLIDFLKVITEADGERKERVKDLHYYETRGSICYLEDEDCASHLPVKVFNKFPVIQGDEIKIVTPEPIHSTILEFRTRRLIASLSRHDGDSLHKEMPILTGPGGQMIGVLDIHISLNALQLPQHDVELICISVSRPVCTKHAQLRDLNQRDVFYSTCPIECFPDWMDYAFKIHTPASNWQFMCYDVLWIEWEDGIAYRKAIGRVFKDEWDSADTEEVNIRLG
jgi:hypothetical protein